MNIWENLSKGDITIRMNKMVNMTIKNMEDSSVNILSFITDDIFRYTSILKYVEFMKIIDPNNQIWKDAEKILNNLKKKIYTNENLYNKLVNTVTSVGDEQVYVKHILSRFVTKNPDTIFDLLTYKDEVEKYKFTDIRIFIRYILSKESIASNLGFTSYGVMIDDLRQAKINQIQKLIAHIYTKLSQNQLEIPKSTKPKMFTPCETVQSIIKVLSSLFGINICINNEEEDETNKIWDQNVIITTVYNDKEEIIGYLYLDLLNSKYMNIDNKPVFHKLLNKQEYPYKSKKMNLPIYVIIYNYNDLDDSVMTHDDVIQLYHVFGTLLQDISNTDKFGKLVTSKFDSICRYILEYIAVDYIVSKYPKMSKIHRYEYNSYIKTLCIDSVFDLSLVSEENINSIKKNINDENKLDTLLSTIYNNVFLLKYNQSVFKSKKTSISSKTITNILNYRYPLYNELCIRIYAYNLYNVIKNTNDGRYFRQNILSYNNINQFHELVNKFYKEHDIINNYTSFIGYLTS